MSFESIFKTDTVESHATHLKEGFMMGWVPGIITDLRDPEMIGRVKVRCDLLAENVDLPNENDGWVWVTEEFCLANRPGGTHRMLEVGTQVAMIPMMGDARQMLIIGCLPSRVDRPPEGADRAEKRHGKQTPGGVIEMNDDKRGAKVTSFPHGVLQGITGTGDIIYETRDKARFSLSQNGNSQLGNDLASLQAGKNGDVSLFSGGSASANFSADGSVAIASPNNSVLSLDGNTALVTGPNPQVSQRLNQLKGLLLGSFYFATQDLTIIERITDDFTSDKIQALVFLEKTRPVLKRLHQGLATNLSKSVKDFEQLKEHSAVDFAKCCEGQIKEALRLGLGELIKTVQATAGKSGDEIIESLKNEIPDKFINNLDLGNRLEVFRKLSDVKSTLNALKYNPDFQAQLIVSTLVPQGWASVEILFGLGIADKIEELEEAINPKEKLSQLVTTMTPADEKKWWEDLSDRINGVKGLLNSDLVEFISDKLEDFNTFNWTEQDKLSESGTSIPYSSSLLKSVPLEEGKEKPDWNTLDNQLTPGESPLAMLLGTIFKGMLDKISDRLTQLKDQQEVLDKIENLHSLTETLVFDNANTEKILLLIEKLEGSIGAKENPIEVATFKLIPRLYKELLEKILPLIEETWLDTNALINWIPDNPTGASLQAKDDQVQMQSNAGGNGAIVKIDRTSATIAGPEFGDSMRTRIFADKSDAGMQSGDKGGAVRVERRVSEILGPERKADEERNSYLEGENKYQIDSKGRAIAKGAVKKEPKYLKQKDKTPTVRSSMAVDSDGNAMIRSGGNGSSFTVGEQKAEIKGPEVEIDGKKTRTEFFALAGEIGMAAGGAGGTVWMGQEQSEVLGPEIEVDGKKVRRTIYSNKDEVVLWSGSSKGTRIKFSDTEVEAIGPDGKGLLVLDGKKIKIQRPEGQTTLEITDVIAKLLGPKGKGILNFTEDLVEMIGRDNKSLIRMAEGLVEMVGPDATKALKIGENLVQLIGGAGSNLTMIEGMVNLSGLGSGLRLTPLLSELTSPFLGAFRMLPGISEVSGGGNSMVVSTAGVYFAVGGAILGLAASGMASIGSKKSSMRNGDEESESGVGMILDPQENKAALVAYHPGEWNRPITELPDNLDQLPNNEEPNNADWEHQSARVYVSDQTVYIQSISLEGEILTEITVGPDGVKINGKNLQDSEGLSEEIEDLRQRVTNLESSID
jgi:hypothetical protein